MNEYDEVPPGYICDECALKQGCTWPKGHCASFHIAECQYCKTEMPVCHISDWNWKDRNVDCSDASRREFL